MSETTSPTEIASSSAASFIGRLFSSLLPTKDPARTISTSALLVVGSVSIYHFSRKIHSRIKVAIKERAREKRREAQKPDVVYLYVFPKKPQTKSERRKNKSIVAGALSADHNDDGDDEKETVPPNSESGVTATAASSSSMITVTTPNKMSKMFSLSAPCMAVELFLRINKIPFEEVVVMDAADVSPTQRLPVIEYNGQVITDSNFIMQFLEKEVLHKSQSRQTDGGEKGAAAESNATIESPSSKEQEQKQEETSSRRIKEIFADRILQSLRLGYGRTTLVNNTDIVISTVVKEFDYPKQIVSFMCKSHRREVIEILNAHGYGDLSEEQFESVFLDDVKALESLIAKKTKKHNSVSGNSAAASSSPSPSKSSGDVASDSLPVTTTTTIAESTHETNDKKTDDRDDGKLASASAAPSSTQTKVKAESLSQFIHGTRMPTKLDFMIAAQLKVMRFFDESNAAESDDQKQSSSSSKKRTKEESSKSSQQESSPTATTTTMTTTMATSTSPKTSKPSLLLADRSPAFQYLMKSEIIHEYLKRMDKALAAVAGPLTA